MEGQVDWVSVKDGLPLVSGHYLVYRGKSTSRYGLKWGVCWYERDKEGTIAHWEREPSTITHWSRVEKPGV